MVSTRKTRIILVALMVWASSSCTETTDEDIPKNSTIDGGVDASNTTGGGEDAGGDSSAPNLTAEECESQLDETACTSLGCTYESGFRGTGTLGEACSYEGPEGFCILLSSDVVGSVETTYVREIDATHDEVMMLTGDFPVEGGWLICGDVGTETRPGCACNYSEASLSN